MRTLGGNRFSSLKYFFLRLSFLFRRHITLAVAAPSLVQSINPSLSTPRLGTFASVSFDSPSEPIRLGLLWKAPQRSFFLAHSEHARAVSPPDYASEHPRDLTKTHFGYI